MRGATGRTGAVVSLGLSLLVLQCGPPGSPALSIRAVPNRIDDRGQVTTLTVSALDGHGMPGVGSVKMTSLAGSLTVPETGTLSVEGTAEFGFSCNVAEDPACRDRVRVVAEWIVDGELVSADLRIPVGEQAGTGGGAGGGTAGVVPTDCLAGPDGGTWTQGIMHVEGFAGSAGAVRYTHWGSLIHLGSANGFQTSLTWRYKKGDSRTITVDLIRAFADGRFDAGVTYAGTNATPIGSTPFFVDVQFVYEITPGVSRYVTCPAGAGSGTVFADTATPGGTGTPPTDLHGQFTFQCADAGMDVHGCFRFP